MVSSQEQKDRMAPPKISSTRFRLALHLPLAVVMLLGAAPLAENPAHAGPGDRIAYMNKKAMEDYDAAEFESARKTLTDAIAMMRKSGSDNSVQAARTYINLGMVYIALKDKSRGQQQFVKALTINPKAKLDPTLATPEMQAVWEAAVAQQSGAPAPIARPVEPPQPVATPTPTPTPQPVATPTPQTNPDLNDFPSTSPTKKPSSSPLEYNPDELLDPVLKVELRHAPPDEARTGQKLNLYITPVPVHQGATAARATLYYRGAGQANFTEQQMQPSRKQQGDLMGQIPPEAVTGKSLQYYIQAFDAKSRPCGNLGTPDNPLIVRVAYGGPAVVQGTDVEDPILYVKRADEERRFRESRDWVYIDIGVGTGGAVITSGANAEVSWFYNRATSMYERSRASTGGFIWSGVGIRAEFGVFVWRGLSIGLSGRFEAFLNHNADSQLNGITGTGVTGCPDAAGRPSPCYATTSKGQYGFMILGKFRYMFRKLYGNYFRPYVHLDVGGGEWRGALNIDGSRPQLNGQVDTGSPFQPTDVCSATYNGNMNNKMPAGCNSVASNPGYNLQDHSMSVIPTNLNRVCPANGPCIDAVLLGKAMIGGGGGFYLGGRRAGISVDLSLITAVSEQFGLFIDAYVSPQINF
jgi:hypothetical protein